MLRLRVLGSLAVEHDGQTVDLPHGRARQLVAYLALHEGPQPRRQVAGQLWPDCSPEQAGQRLRTLLWEVRRALPEPLVSAGREDVGLDDAVAVDLVEARALLESGASEAALSLLSPGLAGELDQDWAEPARREVDALRLRALEAAMRDAGGAAVAVAHARRRVALEPLSETAHGDLIRLLADSGDRGAAMAAYEQLRVRLRSELGVGPSAASRRLLAQLAADDPASQPAGSRPARPRVPVPATPLLGRESELAELAAALRTGRLVTVVGPGGVGKTRLAFAAAQHESQRGATVAVAELAPIIRADACDYVVAAALGAQAGPGRTLRDAMVERLSMEQGLLVLDNCEHLLATVRDLVTHLLRWAVGARVLATSREPLALPGEHTFRLLPLPVPRPGESDAVVLASPAVQLLARTASRGGSDVTRQAEGPAALALLARRLDGLPLALELAAARIPSLGVGVLAERLTRGLELLSAGRAATGGRQDSLHDTLQWSMTLLSPNERTLLGLLSLLPGPFPASAVEAVVGACGLTTDPVVGLARLVEASMVQAHEEGFWFYSALETIRVFGNGLIDDPTAVSARGGLVQWAARFADHVKEHLLTDEARVHAEVTLFLPLVRAGLLEAQDRGEVAAERRIITGIEGWATWRTQPEIWAWVTGLAAREPQERADAEVLRMGALCAWRQGRIDLMRTLTRRCVAADPDGETGVTSCSAQMLLAAAEQRWADTAHFAERLYRVGGTRRTVALTVAATALARSGRPGAARQAAATARREADRLGAPTIRALAMLAEATASCWQSPAADDDPDEVLAEARRLTDAVGSRDVGAWIDRERGVQALTRGRPEGAVEPLRQACLHWLGTGNGQQLAVAVTGLAEALRRTGRPEAAVGILVAAEDGTLTGPQLVALLDFSEAAAPGPAAQDGSRRGRR